MPDILFNPKDGFNGPDIPSVDAPDTNGQQPIPRRGSRVAGYIAVAMIILVIVVAALVAWHGMKVG